MYRSTDCSVQQVGQKLQYAIVIENKNEQLRQGGREGTDMATLYRTTKPGSCTVKSDPINTCLFIPDGDGDQSAEHFWHVELYDGHICTIPITQMSPNVVPSPQIAIDKARKVSIEQPGEIWTVEPIRKHSMGGTIIRPPKEKRSTHVWRRLMTAEKIEKELGQNGAQMLESWKKYNDHHDDFNARMRMKNCRPDPQRVVAFSNMHEEDWRFIPLRLNSLNVFDWKSNCCGCTTKQVSRDAFMKTSMETNKDYGNTKLFYTKLPHGKWLFSDQLIDCDINETTDSLFPTGVIHVHTHPKWRWHTQAADGKKKRFISCKIWVPANTPLYFYMNHHTNENYAALLFVHTMSIHDMYITVEKIGDLVPPLSVKNVVFTNIKVYPPNQVKFSTPPQPVKYGLITPGSHYQFDKQEHNSIQPTDPPTPNPPTPNTIGSRLYNQLPNALRRS